MHLPETVLKQNKYKVSGWIHGQTEIRMDATMDGWTGPVLRSPMMSVGDKGGD